VNTVATLSASAERRLYDTDYPAWLEYAAPRIAARITSAADHDLGLRWSLLTRAAQVAVWPHLDAATQVRVRAHSLQVAISEPPA